MAELYGFGEPQQENRALSALLTPNSQQCEGDHGADGGVEGREGRVMYPNLPVHPDPEPSSAPAWRVSRKSQGLVGRPAADVGSSYQAGTRKRQAVDSLPLDLRPPPPLRQPEGPSHGEESNFYPAMDHYSGLSTSNIQSMMSLQGGVDPFDDFSHLGLLETQVSGPEETNLGHLPSTHGTVLPGQLPALGLETCTGGDNGPGEGEAEVGEGQEGMYEDDDDDEDEDEDGDEDEDEDEDEEYEEEDEVRRRKGKKTRIRKWTRKQTGP